MRKIIIFCFLMIAITISLFCGDTQQVKKVRASHILVLTWEEANQLLEKIRAGEAFEPLAAKYSLDIYSKANAPAGDLGYFALEDFPKSFSSQVFDMDIGEVKSIQSVFGHHVILKTGEKYFEVIEHETVDLSIDEQIYTQEEDDPVEIPEQQPSQIHSLFVSSALFDRIGAGRVILRRSDSTNNYTINGIPIENPALNSDLDIVVERFLKKNKINLEEGLEITFDIKLTETE